MTLNTAETLAMGKLLSVVAEYHASDLHLSVGNPPALRIQGELRPMNDQPVVIPEFVQRLAETWLNAEQQAQLEKNREVSISYTFQDKTRFKIHLFYQEGHLSASLRHITEYIPTIEDLGLPDVARQFTSLDRGLVIFTGPASSGRSTTAAAVLELINQTQERHIVTLENPIEYLFVDQRSVIEQREIGRDALSFEQALESIEDEDADCVFISSMHTPALIEAVLAVVNSGHLVFTIMDTATTVKAIEQIIYKFPTDRQEYIRPQLSDALAGVIAQTLVPRTDGGRVAATEILIPTQAIRTIIRDGVIYQLHNILQTSREEGMISMDASLAELVRSGQVSLEVAQKMAQDANQFQAFLRGGMVNESSL
ncbi:MAG: PilT/PilU family type 4a pilus ATPase [Patescibacteria group bacterium]